MSYSERCREGAVRLAAAVRCGTALLLLVRAGGDRHRALCLRDDATGAHVCEVAC